MERTHKKIITLNITHENKKDITRHQRSFKGLIRNIILGVTSIGLLILGILAVISIIVAIFHSGTPTPEATSTTTLTSESDSNHTFFNVHVQNKSDGNLVIKLSVRNETYSVCNLTNQEKERYLKLQLKYRNETLGYHNSEYRHFIGDLYHRYRRTIIEHSKKPSISIRSQPHHLDPHRGRIETWNPLTSPKQIVNNISIHDLELITGLNDADDEPTDPITFDEFQIGERIVVICDKLHFIKASSYVLMRYKFCPLCRGTQSLNAHNIWTVTKNHTSAHKSDDSDNINHDTFPFGLIMFFIVVLEIAYFKYYGSALD